ITIARYGLGYVFVYYYVPIYIGCTIILSLLFSRRDKTTDGDNSRLLALLTAAILLGLVVGSYLDPALARLGMSNDFIEEAR
ncbi:hypothetical protein, partial [Klebsiella pneumoniae]|uniref:hypothetical protein n=1 Tax=Klebsiella pneumoniae TaxID=573 RepID=UPI001952BFE3